MDIKLFDLDELKQYVYMASFDLECDYETVLPWFKKQRDAGNTVRWAHYGGNTSHTLTVGGPCRDLDDSDIANEIDSEIKAKVTCMHYLYKTNFTGQLYLEFAGVSENDITSFICWFRKQFPDAGLHINDTNYIRITVM